jgi:hypothetical protein
MLREDTDWFNKVQPILREIRPVISTPEATEMGISQKVISLVVLV